MERSRSAGGVVLRGEMVLVTNQNNDSWSLPKGHIDPGEDALEAAKREIAEETGVTELELVTELGTYERYRIGLDGMDDVSELKSITMFLFKTKQEELKPTDAHNPEARWVHKSEVAELLTHSKDKDFVRRVLK